MEARAPQPDLAQPLALTRITMPDCASHRAIFLEIGAPWAVGSRFRNVRCRDRGTFCRSAPASLLHHDEAGAYLGMVELYNSSALFPSLIGRGFGKRLMAGALDQAWRFSPGRMWLHPVVVLGFLALPGCFFSRIPLAVPGGGRLILFDRFFVCAVVEVWRVGGGRRRFLQIDRATRSITWLNLAMIPPPAPFP
ncbi:hypothetical protein [Mesorhizobium sp. M1396]|uniref:hypothetical protein n=1 Tax=unclassified Mesorhizobium TaxID=325217 RepID=UPI0033367F44